MAKTSCILQNYKNGGKCSMALEMHRTFNMGIGMILIVDEKDVEKVKENLGSRGEAVYEIGRIVSGDGPVVPPKGLSSMRNSKKRLAPLC